MSFPAIGDESKVYRIEIPTESNGYSFPVFVDYLVYRVGRGTGVLAGINFGDPFDQRLLARLGSTLAKRAAEAGQPGSV